MLRLEFYELSEALMTRIMRRLGRIVWSVSALDTWSSDENSDCACTESVMTLIRMVVYMRYDKSRQTWLRWMEFLADEAQFWNVGRRTKLWGECRSVLDLAVLFCQRKTIANATWMFHKKDWIVNSTDIFLKLSTYHLVFFLHKAEFHH